MPNGGKTDESLALDLLVLLHSHSAQLSNITEWLEPLASYLQPNPFPLDIEATGAELEAELLDPVQKLRDLLRKHLADAGEDSGDYPEPLHLDLTEIAKLEEILFAYIDAPSGQRVRDAFLRTQIERLVAYFPPEYYRIKSSNRLRGIYFSARVVQRVLCTFELNVAVNRLRDLSAQARAVQAFYRSAKRDVGGKHIVSLHDLLQRALRDNEGFAQRRGIQIRQHGTPTLRVMGHRESLASAFSYLLNNAIKYNYTSSDFPIWIDVRASRDRDYAKIEIENWGYPITADEIDSGVIFRPGRRGTFASRSGRPGSGIGLAEAKRIVEEHSGSIEIKSLPAKGSFEPKGYDQPFMTSVTVRLKLEGM
jgi:signal transduction histidine kinase